MLHLPPLENLRFFEAAARHGGFARAAAELRITPAAVAHRVRALEQYLDVPLFDRGKRGVRLTRRGQTYLREVQRILAEVHGVSERHRHWPRPVRIVSVEAVAEKWLVPRLASFSAAHRGIAIELETNHRGVDPEHRDFDVWFAYTGSTSAPRPMTRRENTVREETLYEEQLFPVCSPALLAARGKARGPAGLQRWPLLYDLGWDADWVILVRPPGLSRAGPVASLGLSPLQHARPGRSNRARGRHRTPHAHRARVGTRRARACSRPTGRGARTLLSHHHGGLPATSGGPGVPEMGAGGGQNRKPQGREARPAPCVTPARECSAAQRAPNPARPSAPRSWRADTGSFASCSLASLRPAPPGEHLR